MPLDYVSIEMLTCLYTLEGHGEKTLSTDLKDSIEKANIEVEELNLLTEENVPEDANCLMIVSPTTDLSSAEKEAVFKIPGKWRKSYDFFRLYGDRIEKF